jgi:glycine/D-amino acid oxidase-like deaminating enzyme
MSRMDTDSLEEGRYDVTVVGGGRTGSSTALALAKKGARVVVLEAGTIGNAASGRNGGICNDGFAQHAIVRGQPPVDDEVSNRMKDVVR